jgi:hypothetical protein
MDVSATSTTKLHPLSGEAGALHPNHVGRLIGRSYERHRPEETLLYKVLQDHWLTFLRELELAAESSELPAFVVAEVEAYLRCGILAHGLVLAKCSDCG